ncbi:MAG: TetR/AcrR family transcriptional regulator [Novosphingobium sp.]|nr:TetR/AcrR family transcriptional regulator [Novosphingobium sp.]
MRTAPADTGKETGQPARTARRKSRKPGANREAIIAAAATVFLEHGYHQASLDDIAGRIGISKPTIYYWVGGKEAVLAECMRQSLSGLMARLDTIESDGLTGADQLDRAVRYCVGVACTDLGRCVVRIPDHVLSEYRNEIRGIKKAVSHILSRLHEKGIEDGTLRSGDPRLIGQLLRGLINSVGDWFDPRGAWTPDHIADTIVVMAVDPMRVTKD